MQILIVVLFILLCSTPSFAMEFFIEGGIGQAQFQRTTPDGIWWQQPFNHSFNLTSLAYKTGGGIQLDEHWSIVGSYVSMGTIKAVFDYISDDDYASHNLGVPQRHGAVYDTYKGLQVLVAYQWTNYHVQPKLFGGMAYMSHKILTKEGNNLFEGDIPMLVIGSGVCYTWVCGEVTYYRGVSAPMYPISTQVIVPMVTIKIPF